MNYINDTTKEQLSHNALKAANPDKSLPAYGTPVIMDVWYLIVASNQPAYDKYTQAVDEVEPVKTGEIYNQTWAIVSLVQEDQDAMLTQSKSNKVYETWRYANSNIASYENGLVSDANTDKSKRLSHDNDARTNKRINSEALTPDEDTAQADFEGYIAFSDDTNSQANTTEDSIMAMTDGNAIDDIVVADEPFPAVPYSTQTQETREMLIGELVSQSTIIFADYDQADQDTMSLFIDDGIKGTLTGAYASMPGGRQVYEVVGQDELASVNCAWVITQHMAQNTYFDTVDGIFKK